MKTRQASGKVCAVRLSQRIILGLGVAAAMLTASASAATTRTAFGGVEPTQYGKKWSFDDWHVWALPSHECLAMESYPNETPFRLWGFRQSPGSRLQLYFGSIENAQPRTVQMSFNDGGQFDYDAEVVRIKDWDVYSISMRGNALSVFPSQLTVEASVGGERVFMNVYNAMGRVRDKMTECLAWQQSH